MFFNNGWYRKEKPLINLYGLGGGATGFAFGGASLPEILIENINPALPNGATTWNLAAGDLILDTYSSRSFTFADTATRRITVIGAGSAGGWKQLGGPGNQLTNMDNVRMGASGGANVADVNVVAGTTYWAHVGEGSHSTWQPSNPRSSASTGAGASAFTLAPSTTGTEVIVAGGAGGTCGLGGGFHNWNITTPFGSGPYNFGPSGPDRSAGGGGNGCPGYPYPGNGGGGGLVNGSGGGAGNPSRSSNASPGGSAPRGGGGRAGDTASSWFNEYGRSGYANGGATGLTPGDGPGFAGGGGYAGGGGTNNGAGGMGTGGGGSGYVNSTYATAVLQSKGSQGVFIGDLAPQAGQAVWDALTNADNWTNPLPSIYPYLPSTGNNGGAHPKKYGAGGGTVMNPVMYGSNPYNYITVGAGAIIIHQVVS